MTASATLPYANGSANARLKGRFSEAMAGSVIMAVLFHYLLIAYTPGVAIADLSPKTAAMVQIEVPPTVEIPPPPEEIPRPSVPILNPDLAVDADLTIPPATFGDNPPAHLPPPPVGSSTTGSETPFTPFEVRPELRNREEFTRNLARRYPPQLRNAGLGGTVVLTVHIDAEGRVLETRIAQSSGYTQLDETARELIRDVARFTPALNRDQRVAVWIQLPVTFEAQSSR